jgi:hypothetical protein
MKALLERPEGMEEAPSARRAGDRGDRPRGDRDDRPRARPRERPDRDDRPRRDAAADSAPVPRPQRGRARRADAGDAANACR